MEEKKEVQKSKKKRPLVGIVIVIIIVLLMIACFICGFLLSEVKIVNKAVEDGEKIDKDTKTEEPTQKVYDITDEKVSKLIDHILLGYNSECTQLERFTNDKKVTVNDIPNIAAYHIAAGNEFTIDINNKPDSISLDDFNKAIAKYLGKNYKFNPESIDYKDSTCPQYYYDKNTKTFKKQETACGWTCGPRTTYKLTKAVETDGVLELDVKVIFAQLTSGKEGYYSDYQKTNKIGTIEEFGDSLFEKGTSYKFTFKNEDGNYIFVSSEPAN